MSKKVAYSIAAAARLTGVSSHTLRKWEERYGAVRPSRTPGGDRRYSASDIERAALLKELVESGHAISTVGTLDNAALDSLVRTEGVTPAIFAPRARVAVVGHALPTQLTRHVAELPGLDIVEVAENIEQLQGGGVEVVVMELASATDTTQAELDAVRERTGVEAVVVLFAFASIAQANALSDDKTAVMRLPVVYNELNRTVGALVKARDISDPDYIPEHRYSKKVLARVVSIVPELACECPRHVAELLFALTDFENYSADCEQSKPADARIHKQLRHTAAVSRSLFEKALADLAAHENIPLVDD